MIYTNDDHQNIADWLPCCWSIVSC